MTIPQEITEWHCKDSTGIADKNVIKTLPQLQDSLVTIACIQK